MCEWMSRLVLEYLFVSLTGSDLGFPLLSIFHPLAMKFILIGNKIWSLLLNALLMKTHPLCFNGHFFGTLLRHWGEALLSLRNSYTKKQHG
jgi:hypothetical protein